MKDQRKKEWDEQYRSEPIDQVPWFLDGLDHDFKKAAKKYLDPAARPAVLDIGTGPGTQAVALASLGYDVSASDVSPAAVRAARERAERVSVTLDLRVDDITQTELIKTFQGIFDRGVFHTLEPGDYPGYITGIKKLLESGGYLFLKCFSTDQPGTEGPRRISETDLRSVFRQSFEIRTIRPTEFRGNHKPPPKALFAVIQKR